VQRQWFLAPPGDRRLERFGRCAAGLALFGAGVELFLGSDLGASPWDVLHQGIARISGLPVGLVMELTGLAIVMTWFPLGLRPGWGTLMNAIEVGLVVMLLGPIVPEVDNLAVRCAYLAVGLLCFGAGTGLYIGAGLGSGPRDGLMLGFAARGWSLRLTRTVIEVVVLLLGIALGGTVGVGTAVFTFGIGPAVQYFIPRLTLAPAQPVAVPAQGR
jgi:uncharacterized membrane protein YczE